MRPKFVWFAVFSATLVMPAGCGPKRVSRGASPQELAWQRAHELREKGQTRDALTAYRSVCESGYDRGCLSEIRLLFDMDEREAALERVFLFFERHPASFHGSSVVDEAARFFVGRGRLEEGWRYLGHLAEATEGLEVHDAVLYERASLARRLGEPERERAELERLVSLYGRWESQLWDDAVWRLVEKAETRGDTRAQERWLGVLLEAKETSRIIGSYDSPYHDDALLMLARLHADQGEIAKALELLYDLSETEKSRLKDDALAEAMRFAARYGKNEEACDAARRLMDEEPQSRFVPEARRFLERGLCEPR